MALTWRRGGGRQTYQPADLRPVGQTGGPSDDYLVETGTERVRPPASVQIVRVLQAVLVVAIALLSLAVFWMIGLIFGIL
jgi:hypothetical protein